MKRPRFITLTRAPEDWQRRRGQIRDLARRLRADGLRTEWIWTTEAGKLTGMIHCHLIQIGDYIPQAYLQELWGDRRADIRAATTRHGEYISKSAGRIANYVSKGGRDDLETALSLNGGRLHHWSRGWWGMPIREYRKSIAKDIPRDCVLVFAPDVRKSLNAQ